MIVLIEYNVLQANNQMFFSARCCLKRFLLTSKKSVNKNQPWSSLTHDFEGFLVDNRLTIIFCRFLELNYGLNLDVQSRFFHIFLGIHSTSDIT